MLHSLGDSKSQGNFLIERLVQKLPQFGWRGEFCLLVELHREGSAPAACAAGLFK